MISASSSIRSAVSIEHDVIWPASKAWFMIDLADWTPNPQPLGPQPPTNLLSQAEI